MSINNLFLQLKDIQYQADKLLKSKRFAVENVKQFALNSVSLRKDLINLNLSDEVLIHAEDIEDVDLNYQPDPDIMTYFLGTLSFGIATKTFQDKKKEEYLRSHVLQTKNQFACIEHLLREL